MGVEDKRPPPPSIFHMRDTRPLCWCITKKKKHQHIPPWFFSKVWLNTRMSQYLEWETTSMHVCYILICAFVVANNVTKILLCLWLSHLSVFLSQASGIVSRQYIRKGGNLLWTALFSRWNRNLLKGLLVMWLRVQADVWKHICMRILKNIITQLPK